MIRADMIPDEVVRALKQCLNGCDCDECLAVCIAAALQAWPGAAVCHYTLSDNEGREIALPLPFPQEASDE